MRFVDNARSTFVHLAGASGIGSPVDPLNLALDGLRKWRIEGFPKLLIFYAVRTRGIDVVRVLHAASD